MPSLNLSRIYGDILASIGKDEKLLAVLIDPDKMDLSKLPTFMRQLNSSMATHVFVGGSTVEDLATEQLVIALRQLTGLPIVLFPGDVTQVTGHADAILFLSLLSGRNADYLIGKHVEAVPKLSKTSLEVIPTGYLLIENGKETAVQTATKTQPIPRTQIQHIANTAKAGELLGMKLIYLEAGSGALQSIPIEIIKFVKKELGIPLIVGGGIKSKKQLFEAYHAGADLVVIGTAFENDESFFNNLQKE